MALHTEKDMSQVPAAGEAIDEGWYHVRTANVEEKEIEVTRDGVPTKENKVFLQLKVQGQHPPSEANIGNIIFENTSLEHHLGLQKLKAYYKAAGYNPGPEGHDPEKLLDCEFWVAVEHTLDKKTGKTYGNVAGWSIRSLQDGPGKKVYKKPAA